MEYVVVESFAVVRSESLMSNARWLSLHILPARGQ